MFFKDKQFTKSMMVLAIPIALQNLITAVLNIFDQVMVGMLPPSIADECLSAVVLVNQIVLIYMILLFATSNTANIFIARYTDDFSQKLIPNRFGLALIVSLVAGVLCSVLGIWGSEWIIGLFNVDISYRAYAVQFLSVVSWSFVPMAVSVTVGFVLRAIKRLKIILIASSIGVVCNIILNYVLMFGLGAIPAYGFIGAAYGTVIARIIEMLVIVIALIWRKYPIIARPSVMFKYDLAFVKQFLWLFIPILFNEISWSVSSAVFLYAFDKQPDAQVVMAAYNITSTIDRLISVVMVGVGAAACVVLGNVIAEKDDQKTYKTADYCAQFGWVVGLVVMAITVLCAFFAPYAFVNASAEAKEMATYLTLIYAVSAVFRSLTFMLIVGILRSGGDTKFCVLAESLVIWIVGVPLVLVGGLVFHWNIYILVSIIMACELIKTVICWHRLKSRKWLKHIS